MSSTVSGPCPGNPALCDRLLRALPDWFGIEEAIRQYVSQTESLPAFTAHQPGTDHAIGLLTIRRHFDRAAEIHVIAVDPEHHGCGVGRALVEAAADWLRSEGIEFLTVKTLSPAAGCEHYDRTRRFYESVGFTPLEEFPTLWNERNPCLMMIMRV